MDEHTAIPAPPDSPTTNSDSDLVIRQCKVCPEDNAVEDEDVYYNGPPIRAHWLPGRRFFA